MPVHVSAHRWALLVPLFASCAVAACGDKADDSGASGSGGTDGASDCATDLAVVSGAIAGADAPTLVAVGSDGQEVAPDGYGDLTDDGLPYELELAAGAWILTASADGCIPDSAAVDAQACATYGVSFELTCE